ncbi:MAG: hypothetical protein VXW76_08155 [Actinomycetota bacterium]|nr:hypothetical protein [Actinomycetota bacterium]
MAYSGDKHFNTLGTQSVRSTADLFQGFWSRVDVCKGGFPGESNNAGTPFYLGLVQEGALEISREDTELLGTQFPQVVELLTPSQVGMKFSGNFAEFNKHNLRLAIGGDVTENDNFIYPGASCEFGDVFVSLRALRKRCDGFIMDCMIWKTIASGALTIAGGAEVINSAIEFNALDDSNGDLGGSTSAPLGYLYAPDPQGATAPNAVAAPTLNSPADAS